MSETETADLEPLTEEECRILEGTPFPGLRPGDNLWPEINIVDVRSGHFVGDGAVVDRMIRRQLLVGEPMWAGKADRHPSEGFRIDFPYIYRMSTGAARLLEQARGRRRG
ncbi:hypothetical protein IHV25_04905 [Phaeovibrio sulfidiphilus]|uniref:Uncharacterized protein n=1 Tax=Phaeovibrio sulfidiphilus TaxID=1220600 RepID=A0A8J6YYR1_9PROT|nr:hypothetical protein [Phaeovibrio sulfidiphilus]MBE1236983.1 hypothetical protein [Phaeovibrio sulfidiphilus]